MTKYRLEQRTRAGQSTWRIQYQKQRTHWLWWLGFKSKKWDWVYAGHDVIRGGVTFAPGFPPAIFDSKEEAIDAVRVTYEEIAP